ncbi:MAG TPA: O-antigen ligase family protein [Candidatus Magasanikbacteria bacterium]|nr:O-antigen ligase family protein [Candidatus Magasanikbacteria bacterium]
MFTRVLQIERILVYVWGIVFPWQTIWIYHTGVINDVVSPYLTLGFYISEVILWLLCIVSFFNFKSSVVIKPVDIRAKLKKIYWLCAFCAFPLYLFFHTWVSINFDVSVRHALFLIEGYMLLTAIIVSKVPIHDWVRAFLIGSIAPIALGLFQWFTQTSFSSTVFGLSEHIAFNPGSSIVASDTIGRWLRAYGSFPHPNIFGGYLVCVLTFTFLYSCLIVKVREKIGLVIIHVCTAFTLFTTLSRSAIIAYIFVCMGFVLYAAKNKIRNILLLIAGSIIIGLVCGVLYHDLLYTRTIPTSLSETRSLSERQEGIEVAWKLHRNKPILGFGGGTFIEAWNRYDSTLPSYIYQPVHISLFAVLVEYGLIGVLLFSISFALFVWFGTRSSGDTRMLFLISGVLPFTFISFFDHYFVTVYPGIILFFAYLSVFFRFSTSTPQYVHKM